ncbi:MAG: AAA family ATPase, partial [Halanaerobiales bacterium]|nr:AAA family ATPase [Halanaerobiales bacterium]
MKSYISAIVIFNEKGEKRFVDFKQGVNIITGDSKTGKSALLEIIDYCLCSSRSTIPKGKITEFGHLFCLLLVIDNYSLIIARRNWKHGGKMYIATEKVDYSFESLDYNYFADKTFVLSKTVQYTIENKLGLQVSNLETDDESRKDKKASLRNMISYMFQHQNLMASKFALFYRFSDYYKRKDVIEQFPVFAGIIEQDYYSSLIKLNTLKKDLKKLQKAELQNKAVTQIAKERFLPILKNYCNYSVES